MPANLPLQLRDEFRKTHMRGTAIELRNRQGTGWTQRDPAELLRITYPTGDVQRSLAGISTGAQGRPLVFLGQRGRGKSHIMALLHHAIESPDTVNGWAHEWGAKPGFEALTKLTLPKGFIAITETLSNQEYRTLWDLIFERHPRGDYYRGRHANSGISIPAKSLLQDLFAERPTALVLDEFQTWFDGLHDEPGDTGLKRRQWAFNFVQILSELAKERPDLLMLVVSVRDTSTEGYRQIHRIGPVVIDFKGESAKEDRKRLLLPWNPMDMEQRIGRIHRYGQRDTAQVYNLVSADTIEGQIFLLLEQKLLAIAQTLGKVDEYGQVTEDLRSQVLGQLAERISYEQLYQDAVRDPTLKRTKQELEVAVANADLARSVVFELFQELDSFNLEDYRQFDDGGAGMNRLLAFVRDWASAAGATIREASKGTYEYAGPAAERHIFTTSREHAKGDDDLGLLGLEHPLVRRLLSQSRDLIASERAITGRSPRFADTPMAISIWRVEIHGPGGYFRQAVVPMGVDATGRRISTADAVLTHLRELEPAISSQFDAPTRARLVNAILPDMLRREVEHRGLLREDASLATRLISWIENA